MQIEVVDLAARKVTSHFSLSEGSRRIMPLGAAVDPQGRYIARWVPELRSRGVETIVVLAHAGSFQEGPGAAAGCCSS